MNKRIISWIIAVMMAVMLIIPAGVAEEVTETVSLDPYEEIVAEFNQVKYVEQPYEVMTRPARVTGWGTLRWAPSSSAPVAATFMGKEKLTVRCETPNWLLVEDMETGLLGYLRKAEAAQPEGNEVVKELNTTIEANGKTNLGVIDINGAFSLQCALADGYTITQVKSANDQMVAIISSEDPTKPMLQLSVAYDEAYGAVERMNDLDDEALSVLEKTFTDADPTVEITYGDTGLGTRLMIVRLNEDGMDYLDIFTIYKGYFVECVLVPPYTADDKNLTEEQIQMCVDFLTEMDFVPAETEDAAKLVGGLKFVTNLTDYNPETNTVTATVMHGVPLPAAQAEALKVGDKLVAGQYEEEIETLEKTDEGDILINGATELRKYGDEYHVYLYEIEYIEPYVTLKLEIPDTLVITDEIDKDTGELLNEPVTYTVEEFKAMLAAADYPDFATDNTWVTFGEDGGMTAVERVYSPAQ